jgi:hypothetical protein
MFVSEEVFMQAAIHPFFDPAIWTVTYVIYQAGRPECAIIDSVRPQGRAHVDDKRRR